jgi:hypothetical protein
VATRGTAAALQEAGVQAETVLKIQEGRPNAADLMKARQPCAAARSTARSGSSICGVTRICNTVFRISCTQRSLCACMHHSACFQQLKKGKRRKIQAHTAPCSKRKTRA